MSLVEYTKNIATADKPRSPTKDKNETRKGPQAGNLSIRWKIGATQAAAQKRRNRNTGRRSFIHFLGVWMLAFIIDLFFPSPQEEFCEIVPQDDPIRKLWPRSDWRRKQPPRGKLLISWKRNRRRSS